MKRKTTQPDLREDQFNILMKCTRYRPDNPCEGITRVYKVCVLGKTLTEVGKEYDVGLTAIGKQVERYIPPVDERIIIYNHYGIPHKLVSKDTEVIKNAKRYFEWNQKAKQ